MTKKIKAIIILVALLIALSPSMAMAGGGVPSGVTLEAWVAGPNGKGTGIGFKYSDGFSTGLSISIPYNSAWKKVNPIEPILQAYKEGYGPNMSGEGGILGTTIKFAPNVLAAMKAQNFNPAQVGGANIPPSSTVLNDEQVAWLQRGGYPISTQTTAPSTPTPLVKNDPPPEPAKPQPAPKQETQPVVATKPVTTALVTDSAPKADPSDPVGQTVETPATPMTQEMIAESQKLAAGNPPTINKPNIPLTEQTTEQEEPFSNRNIWIGVTLIVAVVAMVVIYTKRKGKLA